jgi:spore germination protein KC
MTWRAAALAVFLTVFLTGCWSRIEINDLAIVSIVALDREEDGALRVSLQIIIPQRISHPGAAGPSGDKPPVVVVSGTGRTMLDTIRKLQLQLPRRVFLAHANVILIGERLAETGLEPVADFLSRFREVRPTSLLLAVRGEALAILQVRLDLERIPAEAVREVERTHTGLSVTLREFARDWRQQGRDPVLPWLAPVAAIAGREGDGGGRTLKLQGAAFFADGRLAGWLNQQETRTLMMLQGQRMIGAVTMPVGDEDRHVTVEVGSETIHREVTWQRGRPGIAVHVVLEGTLQDTQAPLDLRDPTVLIALERAMERRVVDRLRRTLEQATATGADPFGFGRLVERANPNAWRRLGPRWREEIRHLPVAIDVQARIRKTGLSNRSKAIPEGGEPAP